MTNINVKIVGDSLSPQGKRITSIIATYPRMIHAEVMTHRLFSRNAASSRAIPFKKMIKMVEEDPFIPIAWQKDHKGMQGTEYETDLLEIGERRLFWKDASIEACRTALALGTYDVTKQLCNRLLEPFLWYTALITATEWDNFFELRCPQYTYKGQTFRSRKDLLAANLGSFPTKLTEEEWWMLSKSGAEIHIQALAEAIWDAMNESTPKQLKAGEWHIPFSDKIDIEELTEATVGDINNFNDKSTSEHEWITKLKCKVAVARCARLSYMTFDGEIDYTKDIALHDQLLKSRHMSPFEHVARTMTDEEYNLAIKGHVDGYLADDGIDYVTITNKESIGWDANFRGFIQYRSML